MTLFMGSAPVDALVNPTPTAATELARGADRGRPGALDVAAIRRRVHPDRAGRWRTLVGTFRVPLGTQWPTYERVRNEKIRQWIGYRASAGWQWDGGRVTVTAGRYPAHDIDSGAELEGWREMNASARFRCLRPRAYRLEIPPELVAAPRPAGVARATERQGVAEGGP